MQDEQGLGKDLPSMASASLSNPAATPTGLSKRLSQSYPRHARVISHSADDRKPVELSLAYHGSQPLVVRSLVLGSRPRTHAQHPHGQPVRLFRVGQTPHDGHDDVFVDERPRIVVIGDECDGSADEGDRAEGSTERARVGGRSMSSGGPVRRRSRDGRDDGSGVSIHCGRRDAKQR